MWSSRLGIIRQGMNETLVQSHPETQMKYYFDDSTNSYLICIATKHLNWLHSHMLLNVFRVLAEQTMLSLYATAYRSWLLNTIKQCRKSVKVEGKLTQSKYKFVLVSEVGWKGENEVRSLSKMYVHLQDVAFLKIFCSINPVYITLLGNKLGCKTGKIETTLSEHCVTWLMIYAPTIVYKTVSWEKLKLTFKNVLL